MTDNDQNKTSHDDAAVSPLKPDERLDDARALDIGESGNSSPAVTTTNRTRRKLNGLT